MLFASAGAGLLAKGVSALFSGATREKRQERRYQRKAERQAKKEAIKSAITGATSVTAESSVVTDVATGGKDAPQKQRDKAGKTNIGDLVSKYWWVGLIALFLFGGGGNLLKPKRRAPRRRSAAPRTIVRYRTRKASPRRRKR